MAQTRCEQTDRQWFLYTPLNFVCEVCKKEGKNTVKIEQKLALHMKRLKPDIRKRVLAVHPHLYGLWLLMVGA